MRWFMLIFRQLLLCKQVVFNSLWVSSFWTWVYFLSKWGRRIKEDGLWLISPKWGATFYVCICVCVWVNVGYTLERERDGHTVSCSSFRSQEGSETLGFWADGGRQSSRNFHSYWELNSYKLWGRGGGAAFCFKLTCNLLVSIVALLSYWSQLDLS